MFVFNQLFSLFLLESFSYFHSVIKIITLDYKSINNERMKIKLL